jgi:adenylate cyclase
MVTTTRQLAAIMFTDMVGYTSLMQQNEVLAVDKMEKFRRCFETCIARHHGRILQYYGDGVLSVFNSARSAVQCAVEIQTMYLMPPRIDARIGIHIGEIMTDDVGVYGDGINIASRVESLAVPGSIFITEKFFDEIRNQQDIAARPLGYFELKNINQPMQVYAIANTGIVVPSRDEVKGKLKQTLNSLAVLPFVSLSADPENEYFCDGLSEELINVLSKIEGIQVTSRTSCFAFKGKNEDVREIAARLNVMKVIEGSVRKAGNRVRITVQLINAADGYHIWSETYDRDLVDIFEVQDDISRTVANKLRANLSVTEHEHPLVKEPTENLDAYKIYLQGLHYWNRQTVGDILTALDCFKKAVALEPGFVNPYFNITYITAFMPHAGALSVQEAQIICSRAAAKAMEIDPMNARSQLAAAITAFYFEWDMPKAEHYILKAIELNPNLSEAHLALGWHRMVMQQWDTMDEPIRRAYLLDPMGGETVAGAGEICLLAGKLDLAEEYCNEALKAHPGNIYASVCRAMVVGCRGNWKRAVQELDSIHAKTPEFNLITCYVGYAHARSGNPEKAQELITHFQEIEKQPNSPPVSLLIALLFLALGDKENFYTYFEKSVKAKLVTCLYFYNSPLLEDVRGEARLKQWRKTYNLPE